MDEKKKNEYRISPEGKVEIVLYLIDGDDDGAWSRALGALEIFKDGMKGWVAQRIMAQKMHEKKFGIINPNGKN